MAVYPQAFWDWTQWKDRVRRARALHKPDPPMPTNVKAYFYKMKWTKAPPTWQARYLIHVGYKPPPPPPPPPLPPSLACKHPLAPLYRWPMICAEDPSQALGIPPYYTFFFTADPAYRQNYSTEIIQAIRNKGHKIGAWCNPVQVSVAQLRSFAAEIGTDLLLGQFESAAEFDATWDGGLIAGVGNLSVLRSDQIAKVANSQFIAQVEDYWNVMPWSVLDFHNLPVLCTVKGIYDGKKDSPTYGRYTSPDFYRNAGRWSNGDGAYHANGPAAANAPNDILQLR